MKDFRSHLMALYPGYELHHRDVRSNDILSNDLEYNGEKYRIRVFDVEVIYWCKI